MTDPAKSPFREKALKNAGRARDDVVARHGTRLDGLIADTGTAIDRADWPCANRGLRQIAGEASLFGAPVAGKLANQLGDMIEALPDAACARAAGPVWGAVQLAARDRIAEDGAAAGALMDRVAALREHYGQ